MTHPLLIRERIQRLNWEVNLRDTTFKAAFTSDTIKAAQTAELNKRLADVASEIYNHDTTGMAEPFSTCLK